MTKKTLSGEPVSATAQPAPKPPSKARVKRRVAGATSVKAQSLKGAAPPLPPPIDAAMPVEPFPWEGKGMSLKTLTYRIPERDYEMLKYIGETTYGQNQNKLILMGIRYVCEHYLKHRGLAVERNADGSLHVEE